MRRNGVEALKHGAQPILNQDSDHWIEAQFAVRRGFRMRDTATELSFLGRKVVSARDNNDGISMKPAPRRDNSASNSEPSNICVRGLRAGLRTTR